MPMVDGLTELAKLKSNPMLCKIPFVIFTTCRQETTKKLCHSKGADGFLVKPWTLNNYDKFILSLKPISGTSTQRDAASKGEFFCTEDYFKNIPPQFYN